MTSLPFSVPCAAPGAVQAFLRGVERRGLLVAVLQCGARTPATAALAAVMGDFDAVAGQVLMAEWPVQFWRRLVAALQLGRTKVEGEWPPGCAALAVMAAPDRLALLLRVVAGLDEAMACAALDLDQDGYRAALARACPRDRDGRPDAAAWRALAEAAQAQLRALPSSWLDALRETAAAPATSTAAPVRTRRSRGGVRGLRGGVVAMVAVAGILLLVLLTLCLRRPPALPPEPRSQALPGALHVIDAAPVRIEPLPADDVAPAAAVTTPPRLDPADAAMLADPELALARQADFYAWLAAGAPLPRNDAEPVARSAVAGPSSALETLYDEN